MTILFFIDKTFLFRMDFSSKPKNGSFNFGFNIFTKLPLKIGRHSFN